MNYWLLKSEPGCYGISHLEKDTVTYWDGVRNYQARNFMTQHMKVGDLAFFYHSNAKPSGIAGICKITKDAYPDFTAWDPEHEHFDPKSTPQKPLWFMVDISYVETFPHLISLEQLHQESDLSGLMVLQKGSRLSIQPVSEPHFKHITQMARACG